MKTKTSTALISAFALAVALTGCAATDDQPEDTASEPGQAAEETTAEHNEADVDYISGMIPHHQQAVHMSEMMLDKDDVEPEVEALAEDIREAQGPEIEQMESWLEAWGEGGDGTADEDMDHGDMDHGDMGDGVDESTMEHEGMMSEEDLDQLEESTGSAASEMFLEQMVVHHEGAISSAEQHLQDGENAEALELSEDIIESQRAEIEEMEALLADL